MKRYVLCVVACGLAASLCGCRVNIAGGNRNNVSFTVNGITVSEGGGNSASEAVKKRFLAEHVTTIKADTDTGTISVVPAERGKDEVRIEAVKIIHGEEKPEVLKTLLPSVVVQATLNDGVLSLSSTCPSDFASRHVSVTIDYNISVPPRVGVALKSGSGSIKAQGVNGGGTIHTDYGNIELTDVGGSLDASTSSGSIRVNGAAAAVKIVATSSYGSIDLEHVSGVIEATTSSGAVTVSDARSASQIKLHSDYGKVSVSDAAGAIEASSNSGEVSLLNAKLSDSLKLHSDYGNVDAKGVTSNGPALTVSVTTQSGSATFHGEASDLTIKSDYGSVDGELGQALILGGVDMHSSSGSVTLSLPANVSAAVTASSSSGSVDLPNGRVSSGGSSSRGSVTLGAGAAPVKLESDYGSVALHVN